MDEELMNSQTEEMNVDSSLTQASFGNNVDHSEGIVKQVEVVEEVKEETTQEISIEEKLRRNPIIKTLEAKYFSREDMEKFDKYFKGQWEGRAIKALRKQEKIVVNKINKILEKSHQEAELYRIVEYKAERDFIKNIIEYIEKNYTAPGGYDGDSSDPVSGGFGGGGMDDFGGGV